MVGIQPPTPAYNITKPSPLWRRLSCLGRRRLKSTPHSTLPRSITAKPSHQPPLWLNTRIGGRQVQFAARKKKETPTQLERRALPELQKPPDRSETSRALCLFPSTRAGEQKDDCHSPPPLATPSGPVAVVVLQLSDAARLCSLSAAPLSSRLNPPQRCMPVSIDTSRPPRSRLSSGGEASPTNPPSRISRLRRACSTPSHRRLIDQNHPEG